MTSRFYPGETAWISAAESVLLPGLEARFEQRSVVQHEQPLKDVNAAIGVYADQLVVEHSMVDPGEGNAVRDDSLAKRLVGIGFDAAPFSPRRIEIRS